MIKNDSKSHLPKTQSSNRSQTENSVRALSDEKALQASSNNNYDGDPVEDQFAGPSSEPMQHGNNERTGAGVLGALTSAASKTKVFVNKQLGRPTHSTYEVAHEKFQIVQKFLQIEDVNSAQEAFRALITFCKDSQIKLDALFGWKNKDLGIFLFDCLKSGDSQISAYVGEHLLADYARQMFSFSLSTLPLAVCLKGDAKLLELFARAIAIPQDWDSGYPFASGSVRLSNSLIHIIRNRSPEIAAVFLANLGCDVNACASLQVVDRQDTENYMKAFLNAFFSSRYENMRGGDRIRTAILRAFSEEVFQNISVEKLKQMPFDDVEAMAAIVGRLDIVEMLMQSRSRSDQAPPPYTSDFEQGERSGGGSKTSRT